MIITKDFVILNFPKTGSSFVRKVIKSIYLERKNKSLLTKVLFKLRIIPLGFKELMLPPIKGNLKNGQHGKFYQIPEVHKTKKIVSVARNPYDRFISLYNYRWWVKFPEVKMDVLKESLPHFPNLTINDFLKLRQLQAEQMKATFNIPKDIEIGAQTIEFINMYFKNPLEFWQKIDSQLLKSNQLVQEMADIEFLKQENLNHELAHFLSKYDFTNEELNFVRNHKKINVSSISTNEPNQLSQNIRDYIEKSEWVLFKLLALNGIHY